jgi:hypothetical protein
MPPTEAWWIPPKNYHELGVDLTSPLGERRSEFRKAGVNVSQSDQKATDGVGLRDNSAGLSWTSLVH